MNKKQQKFEKIVRNTCQKAMISYRERPDLFITENNNGIHLTFFLLQETASKCGYNKNKLASLIEPELHRYLN